MSSEIAVRAPGMDLATLGQMLARSGYFADARDAAQAVVKVLAGQEVGLPPIASMTGIHIVKGKVTFAAATVAALIQRSGRYAYRVIEHTDAACEIVFAEDGKEVGRSRFTMEDATRAGLVGQNPTWRSYPKNMVFARALTNGARWYCPSVFGGPVYTPDELRHGEVDEAPSPPILPDKPDEAPPSASPHGVVIEERVENQDQQDRRVFLDSIAKHARTLGYMRSDYTKAWSLLVGRGVTEMEAPIAKLMALSDWLAEEVAKTKRVGAAEQKAPAEPKIAPAETTEIPF